jgi:hypothetical protein
MGMSAVPNPFVGSTMIHFTTAANGPVTLTIFDAQGREVSTPIDGENFEAGAHDVVFEAGDLPNGYYLARLRQGDRVITQSMVLLK